MLLTELFVPQPLVQQLVQYWQIETAEWSAGDAATFPTK
jgi:hypothetical protein